MNPKLLPTTLIVISLLAAGVYAAHGDWRRGVYWLAGATLNFVVTY